MKSFILLLIIAILFLTACQKKEKITPSGKVLKIGLLAPLSRINRKYGYQSLFGIEFANSEKKYLTNGDKIEFHIVDTKSSIEGTQRALQQLLDQNVTAIISFVGSANMLSLKKQFKDIKIPIIVTLATNDEIPLLSDSISQICMSNRHEALVAAHYIKDEKFINSVGLLYDSENPYSYSLSTQFSKYYKSIRGKNTFVLDFSNKNALKKLQNIDFKDIGMVFSILRAKESAKALRILNIKGIKVLLSDGTLSSAKVNVKKGLNLFNGAYIIEHYASNMNGNREYKKLQKILQKEGFEDSSYAFLAYDAYSLLVYALENCFQYEQKCINALFHNSDVIEGIAGNFTMENGKVKRKVYIDKIENLRLKQEIVTY